MIMKLWQLEPSFHSVKKRIIGKMRIEDRMGRLTKN